jgi:formamidopyrimidine-DNA glycosylase
MKEPARENMPELPEVETVVRQLSRSLPGRDVQEVEILFPDLLDRPSAEFADELRRSRIDSVDRRGKNILVSFSDSNLLVVNLGMTGRLLFQPSRWPGGAEDDEEPTHVAVNFSFDAGGHLLYADSRRFGSLRLFSPDGWEKESARLGPEPLDPALTPGKLHDRLIRSRSPIRSWLLDQTKIAGVGNIYASESLFRAGIHPRRPSQSLARQESRRLLTAIQDVLEEAIRARGTTLRDYRTASGDRGGFAPSLRVYGREGDSCLRCNTIIERIVFANRSAFLCPRCQSEP